MLLFLLSNHHHHEGTRTAEQGARTPVKLALLPKEKFVSGKYFFDDSEIRW
jgi:hypothetical protein